MPEVSPSSVVHAFVDAFVATISDDEDPLYQAQVADSAFEKMTEDRGIVVSNAEWSFAPQSASIAMQDALVIIGFWVRIAGTDESSRADERNTCYLMARSVAAAIYDDISLGSRVCDCLLSRAVDGTKSIGSETYAVINLPITLNPTGTPLDINLGEAR